METFTTFQDSREPFLAVSGLDENTGNPIRLEVSETPSEWFLKVVNHPKVKSAPVSKRIQVFLRAQKTFGFLLDLLRKREKNRLEKKLADSGKAFLADSR